MKVRSNGMEVRSNGRKVRSNGTRIRSNGMQVAIRLHFCPECPSIKLIMYTYWTSMFWSIGSCQNRVPADQYHLTVSRAQVLTHRRQVFFELIRWQVTSFQVIAGSSSIFFKFIWNMLRLCAALLRFWLKTDLGCENSASCYRQGRQLLLTRPFDFSHHGHALVTLYVQFLCSDWSKFDWWVHAENLCSILNLVYFDSWSWQSFVSTCEVFNCLFHWTLYKMKFSCYQESSVIHG